MQTISASVGLGGDNRPSDVALVQQLLNRNNVLNMPATGKIGHPVNDQTIAAILAFQRTYQPKPDGRVDPNGQTFKRLYQFGVDFNPAGKTFQQRVDAFIADAKQRFGVDVAIVGGGREPEWAQKVHIAHMIKYNSFALAGKKPKHYKTIGGHNLIDWAYLKEASTPWQHVQWQDFLRTANGLACLKSANQKSWQPGHEPDEAETRKRAGKILAAEGIATADDRPSEPNSAMVAPGYQGCADPCLCGRNMSNHISGKAMDLTKLPMKTTLPSKFVPAGWNSLNHYLAKFGLMRPMASESWHVEPIQPCP